MRNSSLKLQVNSKEEPEFLRNRKLDSLGEIAKETSLSLQKNRENTNLI